MNPEYYTQVSVLGWLDGGLMLVSIGGTAYYTNFDVTVCSADIITLYNMLATSIMYGVTPTFTLYRDGRGYAYAVNIDTAFGLSTVDTKTNAELVCDIARVYFRPFVDRF